MFFSPEYAWLELVLIGGVTVFISDLIGNILSFRNRVLNALMTAIVFAVIFSAGIYLRFGTVMLTEWGFAMMRPAP
jgi:hypothetical protein